MVEADEPGRVGRAEGEAHHAQAAALRWASPSARPTLPERLIPDQLARDLVAAEVAAGQTVAHPRTLVTRSTFPGFYPVLAPEKPRMANRPQRRKPENRNPQRIEPVANETDLGALLVAIGATQSYLWGPTERCGAAYLDIHGWPQREERREGESRRPTLQERDAQRSRCRRSATIRCPRGPSRRKEGSESRLSRKYATCAISAQPLFQQHFRSPEEDSFSIVHLLIHFT